MVSTIAGSTPASPLDGIGAKAGFRCASSLLVTRDGARILVADAHDNRVRVIDTATRAVTTLVGTGKAEHSDGVGVFASISVPCSLAFDEASHEPESRAFIAARQSIRCLTFAIGAFLWLVFAVPCFTLECCADAAQIIKERLQPSGVMATTWLLPELWGLVAGYCAQLNELSTIRLSEPLDPFGIACTPSGVVLVACTSPPGVYSVAPSTGHVALVAEGTRRSEQPPGLGQKLCQPLHLTLAAPECCAYVTDYRAHCIRRVTLPQHWFVPKTNA